LVCAKFLFNLRPDQLNPGIISSQIIRYNIFMRIFWVVTLLVTGVFLSPFCLHAQEKKSFRLSHADTISTMHTDSSIESERDIKDLYRKLLKIKQTGIEVDSVTSQPIFSYIPAIGYTLQSRLAIIVSGNVAFRLDPQSRISSITASTAYTENRQFTLPVESNIWTKDNQYNFVGDYRFYKYPQSTFGLGSNSNIHNEDPMNYNFLRLYEVVMRHITGNFYAGAGYGFDYHWNISHTGPVNGAPSDYTAYGAAETTVSSGISVNMLYDNRDNSINPSDGFYAAAQYKDNVTYLGSNSNWRSLIIDVRKYYKFPANSDNVLALWSYDWLTLNGKPPYLDLPANSWDPYTSTGRGYIQGRFRGAQMVYLETEYRYKITRNGLLGGVFFINAESFSAAPGTALQSVQPAIGPGLRIKLSKISKTNIAIDYGFGNQGSRGVFVNVGEVF